MTTEPSVPHERVLPKLLRIAIDGSTAFYGAVLQELTGHPYLVLRSGHLLLFEPSMLVLAQMQQDPGVVYGPSKIRRVSEPEPTPLVHSTAHRPSKHVASGNRGVGAFIMVLTNKTVVTGRKHWALVGQDEMPNTPEGMEILLDRSPGLCESHRDGINQALDSLLPLLP